ncbi:DUF1735 domain-containing protein [Parafilimonas terrae]|uniref:BT-3987-like N-terminal domain-containing protein n=1 Tax=Parafilimonas terrae TaxID=1465490 RepID=A0A1I5Z2S9_9BACT|nr:DUF1735 domain-containing protein [Parafilimonas terrae]SFQ50773.1 protein of unknown function [Parafilimonas terrae]
MKRLFKIGGSLLLLTSMMFTSCLKDDSLTLDTGLSDNVTEFGNTGSIATNPSGGAAPRFAIDLGSLKTGDTASFKVNVNYAGDEMAPQDITVTVDIDESLLATYNAAHSVDGANYIAPPASLFKTSFPITLVIPKGKQTAQAVIEAQLSNDYDFNAAYALPLKITSTSVGEVSGNFGSALYSITVRNIYDGEFTVTGSFVDLTNSTFTATYPKTADLITTGPASNAYYEPDLNGGTFGYAFNAGGSGSYYGSFAPVFTFDADGNVLSVVNYYGQPSSNGRSAELDPAGENKMTFDADGTPKELNVSYFMLQPGTSVRCKFAEKYVYVGPRP